MGWQKGFDFPGREVKYMVRNTIYSIDGNVYDVHAMASPRGAVYSCQVEKFGTCGKLTTQMFMIRADFFIKR
ncbi:hypothetical protein GCM10011339_02410 [Echinicola rosea]|uniref:Uncharacterized protein n=1 Tax=Echinicola rosea TaxID=1807691 RepID=A0ABQ1UJ22_9BACT|nr:hypothetical protein GCM10011339_02410 [Echinicola rosea]